MKKVTKADSSASAEEVVQDAIKAAGTFVSVKRPKMGVAIFDIESDVPLVIHRFSQKVAGTFIDKITEGTKPAGKKKFEPRDLDEICKEATYYGETDGKRWEGFNAAGPRKALISACRGANLRMTLVKQAVFVLADGYDLNTPMIPLVRIEGKSERTEMVVRNAQGVAMMAIRPMYKPWAAKLRIKFDSDIMGLSDLTNLLIRAGECVGLCEGRPDSTNSAGMGWGTFKVANVTQLI